MDKWIKVQDRLPEKNKLVLVVIRHAAIRIADPQLAFRMETSCGGWTWRFKGESRGKVLFWQPLPELPSE